MHKSSKIYPFKFLDSYTQEDKDIFFGRDEEIKQLYEMLFQSDLILVYGASGTGKTSLIQCGLANQFNAFDWFPIPIRRKSNLNDAIEEALSNIAGTNQKLEVDDDFENIFSEEEDVVSDLERTLKKIYRKHFRPIYLIFDQFEELYVLGSKEEQKQFVQTVKEIMQIEQPIKILLSIREEYLGSLYEFEKAVPELLRKKLRIEAMNLDKVRQVLEGIDQNPHTIVKLEGTAQEKQDFTEEIFQKVQGEEKGLFIQLPYLQVFLDKLYRQITQDESFQQEATFNLAELQKIGDIGNVLRDFLEEQVIKIAQKLKEKDESIWKILSPFATLEGTKEPLSEEMLKERLTPDLQKLTTKVISAFENARILRFSEKDGLYEITHDTLAKQIASKRSDEDIAILEIQTLIKNQLAFGKDLFSKKQVEVIVPYLDKLNLDIAEEKLIQDSQAEVARQEQARKRRNRNIRTGVTVFVLFLASLSILALWQWRNANQAKTEAKKSELKAKNKEKLALKQKAAADSAKQKADEASKVAENEKQKALDEKQKTEKALEDLEKQTALRKKADEAKKNAERQQKIQAEYNHIQKELDKINKIPKNEKQDQIRKLQELLQKTNYDSNKKYVRKELERLR